MADLHDVSHFAVCPVCGQCEGKLAWVEQRIQYHCDHWKAFEMAFIQHYVKKATYSKISNMAVDEPIPSSGGSDERVTEIQGMNYICFGMNQVRTV
jgi:hypothetical protein